MECEYEKSKNIQSVDVYVSFYLQIKEMKRMCKYTPCESDTLIEPNGTGMVSSEMTHNPVQKVLVYF